MIGKLSGILEHKYEDCIIVMTHGVGYLVTVPTYILHQSNTGEPISLFIETLIRPEMITLYGFKTLEEKMLFQKLMSVQGIGGKSASAILSVMSPEQILEAIMRQDANAFKRADGVGPKVATRILTELKDYAQKQGLVMSSQGTTTTPSASMDDALSTLLQLGYKRYEASQVLQQVVAEMPDATTAQLIPAALKHLAKNIL